MVFSFTLVVCFVELFGCSIVKCFVWVCLLRITVFTCLTLVGDFAWAGGFWWFLWVCFVGGFDSFGGVADYAG